MTEDLAIIAGKVSGNLECVDVDCKYDITHTLMKDLCDRIKNESQELFDKFLIQMATPLLLVDDTSSESPPYVPFYFHEL